MKKKFGGGENLASPSSLSPSPTKPEGETLLLNLPFKGPEEEVETLSDF